MTTKQINIISENIIKPNFFCDLKYNYTLNWALSSSTFKLDIKLSLPNFINIEHIIQLINWFKYKNDNHNLKFKFNFINWDDEKEFDFQNSMYLIFLDLDCKQNSETNDFYKFCDNSLKNKDVNSITNFLKNILNKEYFE